MEMRSMLKNKRAVFLTIVTLVVGGSVLGFWGFNRGKAEAEYITREIQRGDIIKSISATGTIQPLVTVQVGSQVSGTIAALFADFNSVVKKGQIIAKLDPAIFQAQLEQARANLAHAEAAMHSAESAVANAQANVLAAEANKERARVAMEDAQRVLRRTLELQKTLVVSQRDLESAQAAADQTAAQYRQAVAQLEQAKAQLLSAKAQLVQAKAQVKQARAAVQLASVNLSHTIIRAPIDGVVVARNVDVGQTVAASLQAPTLFLIANDLTKMQVLADIDEADVGQLSPESRVTFTVDAYPRDTFHGRITQLRLNPQTEQTVVTYTAVIDVDNPELKLKPGMTANVTVIVAERKNVLKVPNAALRFRPSLTPEQQKRVAALLHQGEPSPGSPRDVTPGDGSGRRSGDGRRWATRSAPENSPAMTSAEHQPRTFRVARGRPTSPARDRRDHARPGMAATSATIPGWSPARPERPQVRIIWVLDDNHQLKPVRVKLGITDGVYSEVIDGQVKEHDLVVVGQTLSPDEAAQRPSSPFGGPFGRRRRR